MAIEMNLNRYAKMSVLIVVMASSTAWCESTATKQILRVGYLPATHDTLLFIADSKNMFPEGLEVQLVRYTSSPDILKDISGEKIDLGIPGVAAPLQWIADGAAFKIVAGAAQESAAVVVCPELASKFKAAEVSSEKPETKLANRIQCFAGLRIGSVKQSTGDAIFRRAIREFKVDVDLTDSYRDPTKLLSDLAGGKLQGAVLWSPHMTNAERMKNEKNEPMYIALWLWEVMPKHVCCRQVVRADFLEHKRVAVVMYLQGLIKAMSFYDDPDNKEAVLAAVQARVSNDREVLEKELYADRRTKVSVDLNRRGIQEYLEAMTSSRVMKVESPERLQESILDGPLMEAYLRLGLSERSARQAVDQGFELVKAEVKAQLTKTTGE